MKYALMLTLCMLTACQRGDPSSSETVPSAGSRSTSERSAVVDQLPSHTAHQIPSTASVKSAGEFRSWSEWIASSPAADQEYLSQLNNRYVGLLSYGSEQELEALTKAGFPTPEEWLAARDLSDVELEARAEGGNIKAQIFYADRMAWKAHALKRMAESIAERNLALAKAEKYAAMALSEPGGGAFAAYLYGFANSERTGMIEYALAGALVAGDLGDPRAVDASRKIQDSAGQKADAAALHLIYSSMRRIADRRHASRS